MYIEYITPQRVASLNFTDYKSNGAEYRPTWLVRVSDWQKVPGHKATNGYCALSYCWEQSGEKIKSDDGEYDLIDHGLHRIIKQEGAQVIETNVTYTEVLQQICRDFDIDYLWYDKMCIDQTNKREKHREIKQMHLIYSCARYTVALIPEIHVDKPEKFERQHWLTTSTIATYIIFEQLLESLWWKRCWTLEELMMSTRLLIVGRNTHMWTLASAKQDPIVKDIDFLSEDLLGFKNKKLKSANQVLNYAHCRTSTKEHDKIYALANIFHGIVSIDIDYDCDLSIAMNIFYRRLAEQDLSVMCFGSSMNGDGKPRYTSTMTAYGLPSWTGAIGLHPTDPVADISLDLNGNYHIDDNMLLHLKCRSCIIEPAKYSDDTIFYNEKRAKRAASATKKIMSSMDDFGADEKLALDWGQWNMRDATECLPTHYWIPDQGFSPLVPLSLTEDCNECAVLAAIFHIAPETIVRENDGSNTIISDRYYLSPVVKRATSTSAYKVIGIALLKHFRHNEPRKTPQAFLDEAFKNGCNSTEEFLIR